MKHKITEEQLTLLLKAPDMRLMHINDGWIGIHALAFALLNIRQKVERFAVKIDEAVKELD